MIIGITWSVTQSQSRWNEHSLDTASLPFRLRSRLLQDDEALGELFDIRELKDCEDFYSERVLFWRIQSVEEFEPAHSDAFFLKPLTAEREFENKELFLKHYPQDWPEIDPESVEWYACDFNRRESHIGDWYTMAICRKTNSLYFLFAYWNYVA